MAQPVDVPRWATSGAVITNPSSGQKDTGWVVNQAPPAGFFNWYMNNVYLWVLYLQNITSEVLTWTALQTFNEGVVVTKTTGDIAVINGVNAASARPTNLVITGGNYTGGVISTTAGDALIANGGTGGNAGYGARLNGGDSTNNAGGYGSRNKGGNGLNQGGHGIVTIGGDSDTSSGYGASVKGGDVINPATGTARSAVLINGSTVYTDSSKATVGFVGSGNREETVVINPGLVKIAADTHPMSGIKIANTGTIGADGIGGIGSWGLDMDAGFFMRMRPFSGSWTVPTTKGVITPLGYASTVAKVLVTGGSGGNFTVALQGDSQNVANVVRSNTSFFTVTFTNPYVDDDYVVSISSDPGSTVSALFVVVNQLSTSFGIQARDYISSPGTAWNLDATASSYNIYFTIHGRLAP